MWWHARRQWCMLVDDVYSFLTDARRHKAPCQPLSMEWHHLCVTLFEDSPMVDGAGGYFGALMPVFPSIPYITCHEEMLQFDVGNARGACAPEACTVAHPVTLEHWAAGYAPSSP